MEWYHRSIPQILERQEKELANFRKEKQAAFNELDHNVSDPTGSKRLSLENEWNLKELHLTRNQREILHHRMKAIDQELFPGPDLQQAPDEKQEVADMYDRLDKKHKAELYELAGKWREEIRTFQPTKHDRINREYKHEEELLLDRQNVERDQLKFNNTPGIDQNRADKRADILVIMNQDKGQGKDKSR